MSNYFDSSDLFYIATKTAGKRTSLFDLAIWKNGLAFKNIDFSETGKPVIKIAELNNGISNNTAYTDKEYSQEVALTKGDLLFSWSGNPKTSIDVYRYMLPDGWLNQHIFKVTPFSYVDKDFLFYTLKYLKPNFTKIATNKQTTGLGHVTLADIKRISVVLPNLQDQRKISAILTSLDNKIELNQRQNNNLEQQAQTLFNKLFIDNLESTRWPLVKLGEFISLEKGLSYKGKYLSEAKGVPMLNLGNILPNSGFRKEKLKYYTGEYKPKHQVKFGDIVVANTDLTQDRAVLGSAIIVPEFCQTDVICSHHISIVRESKLPKFFLLRLLNSQKYRERVVGFATGTTVLALPNETLLDYEFNLPPEHLRNDFDNLVGVLYKKTQINRKENSHLSQVRDTLLPKLMSGEIDVSKVKIDEILDDSLTDKLSFSVYLLHLHWNLNSPGWCYYQSGVSAIGTKAALFQ